MGSNGRDNREQGNLAGRVQDIAHSWDSLDSALRASSEVGGVYVDGIKCYRRADEWLIVITAACGPDRVVSIRTASSSGDIGRVVRVMLERAEWKPDRFAKVDKSGT